MPREIQQVTKLYGVEELHLIPNRIAQIKASNYLSTAFLKLSHDISAKDSPDTTRIQTTLEKLLTLEFDEQGTPHPQSA